MRSIICRVFVYICNPFPLAFGALRFFFEQYPRIVITIGLAGNHFSQRGIRLEHSRSNPLYSFSPNTCRSMSG